MMGNAFRRSFVNFRSNLLLNAFIANTGYQPSWVMTKKKKINKTRQVGWLESINFRRARYLHFFLDSWSSTSCVQYMGLYQCSTFMRQPFQGLFKSLQRLVFWYSFYLQAWLPSVYIRFQNRWYLKGSKGSSKSKGWEMFMVPELSEHSGRIHCARWGAPSVFDGGSLRTPLPSTLHRKAVYFYTDPNLVSLYSDHFCACRKKYPIKIYAF